MNRQEKIDAIYEKIADKTLSFGCKIILEVQNIIIAELAPGRVYEDYYEEKGIIEGRYVEYLGEYEARLKIDNIKFYNYEGTIEDVDEEFLKDFIFDERDKGVKIIGHPVMIGNVMDYFNKNNFHFAIGNSGKMIGNKNKAGTYFEFIWNDFLKPIEEQSDECIDFVYDLIFK